ncbi:uncharacterized protein LOC111123810 isoform X2 [Crassostrea virginica]|uniref:Uncharacterized protein LOC111123810 isoform X2 n=1 Tax=Crassostrea virginica TaxID=6565 RepID=A0A8B8D3L3_CRAVI|nr:uncharacterized protein LOC111123810 isoform X2 [Crassostrea virginica]
MSGIREIITETKRCKEVVSILSRENVLALACQIIEQGFHDRLSLLQFGTLGGDVYLFDIQENMDLIAKGGLCSLLDSCEIEKMQNYASKKHWGERPLSEEMVDYCASDVRDLIPELYRKVKDCIEENKLRNRLLDETDEILNRCKDRELKDKRRKDRQDRIWKVINSIEEKWDQNTKHSDFATDSEEILALRRIRHWEAGQKSPFIKRLKTESILCYLDQLDNEIKTEKEEYQVNGYKWSFLSRNLNHPNKEVSNQVKDLQERIKDITLKRMETKYSIDTNLENLTTSELSILGSLFLKSTNDRQFSPMIARLFWLWMETQLDEKRRSFDEWGKICKRYDPFYKKISFYASGTDGSQIPRAVQRKSQSLKRDYDLTTKRNEKRSYKK